MRPIVTLFGLAAVAACAVPLMADATPPVPEVPPTEPAYPSPPPVSYPSARLVVREDCFTHLHREEGSMGGYGRGGGGYGYGAAAPARKSVSISAGPSAAPPPAARVTVAEDAAPQELAGAYDEVAGGTVGYGDVAPSRDDRLTRRPSPSPEPWAPPRGPRVDWGGTVHLSNDDSMSLASAQRVLWALDHDAPFSLDQVRPHELLNYFGFDGTAPAPGETFGLLASAEHTGPDTLALALSVTAASPPRAPLDLTVLVDRSGSMSAEGRMDYTKRALGLLAGRLHRGDRLDLVVFDDEVCTPVRDFVVGRDDPGVLHRVFAQLQPRNSTDLDLGLREAYRLASDHAGVPGRAPRVMVFTDAILNTGDVNPDTVTEVGRAMERHGVRLTGVGVGSEFRDDVLDMLTEKGHGAYVFLGSERVVDRLFGRGFDALVQTVAEDVRFALQLPPSLGMTRFYGEESSTDPAAVEPVSFHAGNRQVFLQDLAIRDGALRPSDTVRLTVTWNDPVTGGRREQVLSRTIGDALAADPHTVRKARALIGWSDVLIAHALGQDACGAPLADYQTRTRGLVGDAEIAYTSQLLGRWCDLSAPVATWTPPLPANDTKVRLDADVPIDEVALSCRGDVQRRPLSASETVARFDTRPGPCQITLFGAVPMTARVEVAATGSDLRCVLRGGRLDCR